MKRITLILTSVFLIGATFSCQKLSGTLSKSGDRQGNAGHAQAVTATTANNTAGNTAESAKDTMKSSAQTAGMSTSQSKAEQGADGYKKDYARIAGVPAGDARAMPESSAAEDAKSKLLNQYAEMDRLADLVVYELNIVERRWDQLLEKFKKASRSERDQFSADLDQLSADQLKLYKAHVKIYKDGKTDWEKTKKEVESTLLDVRGLSSK